MKKHIVTVLKIIIPLGLIAWLIVDCQRNDPETFSRLRERPKDWFKLGAAGTMLLVATGLTFGRWYLLVRVLDIPFRLSDAFRLGFLGYLFNFVSLGHVGGDLFKAVFVAREQSSRRAEAVATILLDRVVGLYSLLVVASLAIAWADVSRLGELAPMLRAIQWLTLAGGIAGLLLLLPARYSHPIVAGLSRVPKLGPVVERVAIAIDMYRRRKWQLAAIGAMSLAVHFLIGLGVHLADDGIFEQIPRLNEHLIISPLASVAGGLPIAPAGVGTYEFAMRYLFESVPAVEVEEGQGLVVALCYRVMTIIVALIGVVYYFSHRREVRQLMVETEEGVAVSAIGAGRLSDDGT